MQTHLSQILKRISARSHHAFGVWPSKDFCPRELPHAPSVTGPHPLTPQHSGRWLCCVFPSPKHLKKDFLTEKHKLQFKLCSEESQDAGHLLGSKHQQDTSSISLQISLLLCCLGFPKHSAVMWFLCMLHLFIDLLAWKSPLIHGNKPPGTNFKRFLNTGNHECHEGVSCSSSSLLKVKVSCLLDNIMGWQTVYNPVVATMSHSWSQRLFCLLCYLTLVLSIGRGRRRPVLHISRH